MMLALPAATPVTTPVTGSTVALVGADDDQVPDLFVAFAGSTVAVKVSVAATARVVVVLLNVTPVTATGALDL